MGRFSGISAAIATVADRLRSQRETGEEMGRAMNILGVKGLVEGTIEPTKEGGFELPGVGRVKRRGGILENVTISPEGELAYKVGDAFIPLKSVSKSGLSVKTPPKPEITKTTALGIISDPVKSEQLKMTYPDVYSLIENIAQGESETQPLTTVPKITPTEERVNVISPTGQKGSIPKNQLEEALKAGYKRTIK